ncbi:PF03932 family protein CutC [Choristoneura fumiferana]|uniref:PF03932 family protein CutC n=1 Tax=Choristoneura fumiferana TaxID=7141 RepID=UPI003D155B9B
MLEVCIDSLQSAINAIHGGADELELCSSLAEGGLTPSVGLVKHVMCLVKKIGTPQPIHEECLHCKCPELHKKPKLNVMIRCRAGSDFCYSDTEMSTMLADVAIFKAMGVDRLVFGALTDVQEIDEAKCTLAVLAAYPLPLTFHRAFDICKNPIFSIEKIIKLGFSRVLTSGQRSSVEDQLAFKCISDLMGLYKDRIEIMPGAGINIDNVGKYIELGCPIVHSSCKAVRNLPRIENNLCMGTGTTESISYTDEKNVIKLQYVIKNEKQKLLNL